MKHASLAAHYRPQTFAEVTGQDMITTVLSRAAAEDRVAPAYLLSGTRGVGKTTIARILAKALNCTHAPTAEPCNICNNCLMVTKGNHVDVTEIDGASNNSVEDARALRENIGYAPMEGRYKVFIIDEAHMLSRSAFNALLKTLEEPPPRVVFVFATTEVHKFPITIVSRCQHFIFKRVSEDGLVAHLSRVLSLEGVDFDPQAVRTIARRANGSVRDSMSLLGQTLALSDTSLTMDATRSVLGLAGQELFLALIEAVSRQDCPTVIHLMQQLTDQGIDIGFFLRELISLWRTLFLLREAGKNILPSLDLRPEESEHWLALAAKFSTAHLHAAWHMTLEAQRKVIHSPEPAAALELLLINLTLMPRLLPIQHAEPVCDASVPSEEKKNTADQLAPRAHMGTPTTPPAVPPVAPPMPTASAPQRTIEHTPESASEATPKSVPISASVPPLPKEQPAQTPPQASSFDPTWEEVVTHISQQKPPLVPSMYLQQVKGHFAQDTLHLVTNNTTVYAKIESVRPALEKALHALCHRAICIKMDRPTKQIKPESTLIEEFRAHAQLKDCLEILDASIYKVRPLNDT